MGVLTQKAKAKAKAPRIRVGWGDRARDVLNSHPKITLGTAGAVVAILGVIVPWLIAWEAQYQRVEAAKAAETQIRSEMKQQAQIAERKGAWQQFGQARTEAIVLRNRLNDCAVQIAAGRKQTPLEIAVCRQYDDEYREADQRAKEARAAAQAVSKAGP